MPIAHRSGRDYAEERTINEHDVLRYKIQFEGSADQRLLDERDPHADNLNMMVVKFRREKSFIALAYDSLYATAHDKRQ